MGAVWCPCPPKAPNGRPVATSDPNRCPHDPSVSPPDPSTPARILGPILGPRPRRTPVRMPGTSKPPTAFPLAGGPSSVSTQSAPEGIRTPNLLIRSQMLYPLSYGRSVTSERNEREHYRSVPHTEKLRANDRVGRLDAAPRHPPSHGTPSTRTTTVTCSFSALARVFSGPHRL